MKIGGTIERSTPDMRYVVRGENVKAIVQFRDLSLILKNKKFYPEVQRGMIDARRRTQTQVQRTVFKQMALKPGNYQNYVVKHTRGVTATPLRQEIFSYRGGQKIEAYKGLKSLAPRGEAIRRLNQGRDPADKGSVTSSVWNKQRVFKRSFAYGSGWFAMLPGKTHKAPRMFWTFGAKKNQPRGPDGRFSQSTARYGKIRRLFGPALSKEIPQGDSLDTFQRVAPVMMQKHIGKRLAKIMKY